MPHNYTLYVNLIKSQNVVTVTRQMFRGGNCSDCSVVGSTPPTDVSEVHTAAIFRVEGGDSCKLMLK